MVGYVSLSVEDRPAAGHRPTILVVDDEPDILYAVKGLLEATLNAHVLVARSAQQGLDLLEQAGHVDLIITDFKMPGMNGLEFLQHALIDHPGTPAVLITAFERELLDTKAASVLTRTILTKPLNPRPMVQTVQRILAEAAGSA
jgi:CheY-like chemotaxis protein